MEHQKDYVSTNFILNKTKTLTKRQLDYWAVAGWVVCFNPNPGSGRVRYFHIDEVPIAMHMDILVNQLHIAPEKAAPIAVEAAKNMNVTHHNGKGKITWVEHPETQVIVGLPVVESLR